MQYSEKELSLVTCPTPLSGFFLLFRIAPSRLVWRILQICLIPTSTFLVQNFALPWHKNKFQWKDKKDFLGRNMPKLPYFEGKKSFKLPYWLINLAQSSCWWSGFHLLHKIEEVLKKKNPASNQLNIATQYVVVEPLYRSQ